MSLEEDFLKQRTEEPQQKELNIKLGVKLKKVPPGVKLKDVKALFRGLGVKNVFFQRGAAALVALSSQENVQKALAMKNAQLGTHSVLIRPLPTRKETEKEKRKDNAHKREFFPKRPQEEMKKEILESGRLYFRNLPYALSESELNAECAPYGLLAELHVPIDRASARNRGFAFATFVHPKDAVRAFEALDRKELGGRKVHVLPAQEAPSAEREDEEEEEEKKGGRTDFQKQRLKQLKDDEVGGRAERTWNPLLVNAAALAEVQALELGVTKEQLLDGRTKGSAAVRLAQVELALMGELEGFLTEQGGHLPSLKGDMKEETEGFVTRSRSAFLLKNLPAFTSRDELEPLLARHGDLERLEIGPKGLVAIVEFRQSVQARRAFAHMAFAEFKDSVLKVEWLPEFVKRAREDYSETKEKSEEEEEEGPAPKKRKVNEKEEETKEKRKGKAKKNEKDGPKEEKKKDKKEEAKKEKEKAKEEKKEEKAKIETEEVTKPNVVLVRNVPFQTSKKELEELFRPFGSLARVRLPVKAGGGIRGFAFAEFADEESAQKLLAADRKMHLYGRRLRLEAALAESAVSNVRARAFKSVTDALEAQHQLQRKGKVKMVPDLPLDEDT